MMGEARALPNLQQGYAWVGDANDVPQAIPTSSFGGGGSGFPFTGSAGISGSLRVHNNNGLDAQFKEDGDIVLQTGGEIDFTSSGNISTTSNSGSLNFTADNQVNITSNTTASNQGVEINARNFRVNLSETGSGAGSFSLSAPGFAPNTPSLLLTLATGSYGDNPTTANMVFTAEDSFFSALGNFYIKNIFDNTGSVYVWSENELTLRGDTSISLEGDTFSNPTNPITVTTRGAASLHSSTDGIMGFYPEIGNFTRVLQNQRAFVETPLVIAGGGTVEVQSGATLKVINEL
jgi:hypothetical protein